MSTFAFPYAQNMRITWELNPSRFCCLLEDTALGTNGSLESTKTFVLFFSFHEFTLKHELAMRLFCSYPCSSLCFLGDLIIGAYGSGHIRVFDSKSGDIHCEVCAHSRWINAIDISKKTGLVRCFVCLILSLF